MEITTKLIINMYTFRQEAYLRGGGGGPRVLDPLEQKKKGFFYNLLYTEFKTFLNILFK